MIVAPKAIIDTTKWIISKPVINMNNFSEKKEEFIFESSFDLDRILSIFENLSLNIWELENLKKNINHLVIILLF